MIEMDKSRDVRRGASRFSRQMRQSGLNGVGGDDFASLEKSKRERFKRLSAVNRDSTSFEESFEMGCCEVSDREEELPLQTPSPSFSSVGTSKRFKLPRKFFNDCNGVDHGTVPRKLRSAMKKRNRESISPPFPDSKKLNGTIGGVESPKRDGVKKSKLSVKQGGPDWSQKQSICGPITKDEEEVVETLYALAGMFPANEHNNESRLDGASLDGSPPALPKASENPSPVVEDSTAIKEDLNAVNILRTDKAADTASNVGRSPEENVEVGILNEPSVQELHDLPGHKKQCGVSNSSVVQVNLHNSMVKHEEQKPSCNSLNFCISPDLYQDTSKLKQSIKLEASPPDRNPEIALRLNMATGTQLDQQHAINEFQKNGPTLWPGLSSTASTGAGSHGSSLQSPAAKIPAWLDGALCTTRPGSFQNSSSIGKVSKVNPGRRSWKRCATHVYISRLIQVLQMPESKNNLLLDPNQLKPHEILKQGVLMTINNFNVIKKGLNGAASTRGTVNAAEKNSNVGSGILQHRRLHQDQPQASLSSGVYTSQKQSFNFLSLSAGGDGVEANTISNGPRNGFEPLAQLQFPYLHSHMQHSPVIPFSMSQNSYNSSYSDLPSVATAQQVQLQLPPYLGNPFCGPHTSLTGLINHQQKQQQKLWTAQLAAQYRTAGTTTSMTQLPSWQNEQQDSSALLPCTKAIVAPSSSSAEVLGTKYPRISQQQQQLMTVASLLPHARGKKQDHHISSFYEETGGGFHTGALPLQLLCNERL